MRLKNKKTGEIGELEGAYVADSKIFMATIDEDGKRNLQSFDSFAELCEEWSDYEEPKGYWRIESSGPKFIDYCLDAVRDNAIGNYFSSKEEAEKAVRKLQAWKRLKDKGFKFQGIEFQEDYVVIKTNFHRPLMGGKLDLSADSTNEDLLDLIFGGEE